MPLLTGVRRTSAGFGVSLIFFLLTSWCGCRRCPGHLYECHLATPSFEERFLSWQDAAKAKPSPRRPRYLGSTESAAVRLATCKAMLRNWGQNGDGETVKELWSVVGGLSALDLLHALSKQQILVEKVCFFDVDETQLDFGKLMLRLIETNHDRDGLVQALYGRSLRSLGDGPAGRRLLGASNMMDFLELPADPNIQSLMSEKLNPNLKDLYKEVFECLSQPSGWPVAWPCFGQKETLPKRRLATVSLTKSQRRLGGNRNEAFHINEVGWLMSDTSYLQLRSSLALPEIEFKLLNLRDLPKVADRRIVFISNIDGSPQFIAEDTLGEWRQHASGTLLLSTQQAEWLQ